MHTYLLLDLGLGEEFHDKVQADVHGGYSRHHHGQELSPVALEVHQLGQVSVGNEGLVDVGTHQALHLPQGTQLLSQVGLCLGTRVVLTGQLALQPSNPTTS